MNALNSILVEGNLVRDPVYKTTAKGTPVCTFSIASNRYYKKDASLEKEVSYFDVECWALAAETCQKVAHKGRGVRVVGRLKQERWNAPDGTARSKVIIVAEHIEYRPELQKNNSAEVTEADGNEVETEEQELQEELLPF